MSLFQSLYVHIPFCSSKCGYCSFFSITDNSYTLRKKYLQNIETDCRRYAERCKPLESAFIGGGTPTYLSCDELENLLRCIKNTFPIKNDCEFTCECNPESLTEDKLRVLTHFGVNRISLGVQTFNEQHRRILNRTGDISHLQHLVNEIRNFGIDNINFDLIYCIPDQTVKDWQSDLQKALELGIKHLSAYELTLEEGAALKSSISSIDEEDLLKMWLKAREVAASYGLRRYEVSNYASIGNECLHNLQIWHGATYLGLGPSASSFDGCSRWQNPNDLEKWLNNEPPEIDHISELDRATEIFAFGLRTAKGWDRNKFRNQTGYNIEDLPCKDTVYKLCEKGLLYESKENILPTEKGLQFADHIITAIL